jgi:hypothetical protein
MHLLLCKQSTISTTQEITQNLIYTLVIVDFERYPFCEVQRFDGIFFKENKSQIKKHDQS